MAGKIQETPPEKWRHQDHMKPQHRIREIRMPTPHRKDPDPSTIGFGITSTPAGSGDGSARESDDGSGVQGKGLPTTIRRAPVFAGNSVSEAPEVDHLRPHDQLRAIQPNAFRRPIVPANTVKDSILGEHVQGPVSQRHGDRNTRNRGRIYDGTVFHSNRPADPEIEI